MIPFAFWKNQTGWTWMGGSNLELLSGSFGTKGVAAPANHPGVRTSAARWIDSSKNLWIFGGYGYDVNGNIGTLNDLWKYDISSGNWTWVSGSSGTDQAGICGTLGTGSTGNIPGGRTGGTSWIDSTGNLWLFGGNGVACDGNGGLLNDLWKYEVSTGKWAWVSGSNSGNQSGSYGTKGTGNAANIPGGRWNITGAGWVDSTGNFWLFGGAGLDSTGASGDLNDLWKYEVSTGNWTWVSGANTINQNGTYGTQGVGSVSNIPGCREQFITWMDASGNLWLFGGTGRDGAGGFGDLNDLWKYTPSSGQWMWVSGTNTINNAGVYGTKGLGSVSNMPGTRRSSGSSIDSSGNFWLIGGIGTDGAGNWGRLNDLWKYEVSTGKWTWISGSNVVNQAGVYGTKGTGSTSSFPGARELPVLWFDSTGVLWFSGGVGYDGMAGNYGFTNDVWKFDPGTLQWAWISGPSFYFQYPLNGTQGVASASNSPGGRRDFIAWKDASGIFWLFGGYGLDQGGNPNEKNDLWKYNPASGQWTWVTGQAAGTSISAGIYGTKGTGSTSNIPGSRNNSNGWIDGSGNLWLFGGGGYDSNTDYDALNDLWRYEPANGKWTWMKGSNLKANKGIYGTKGTAAAANTPGARTDFCTWKDSSGNFWLFGGWGYDSVPSAGLLNDLWKYDLVSNNWTWIAGAKLKDGLPTYGTKGTANTNNIPGGRQYCRGWTDASGNFWLFGGYGVDSTSGFGYLNDLWKYDPVANTWTWVSGANTGGSSGTYGTLGVGSGSNIPGGRVVSNTWADSLGNLWLFAGYGYDSGGTLANLNDLWKYNIAGNTWTWVGGSNSVNQGGVYGNQYATQLSGIPGARQSSGSWIDSSGVFWLYGGTGYDSSGLPGFRNDFWKYRP